MNLYDYRWSFIYIITDIGNYDHNYSYSHQVDANYWINKNIESNKKIAILHRENYKLNATILESSLNGEQRWVLSKLRFDDIEIIQKLKDMNFKYFTMMKNFNYLFTPDAFNGSGKDIILRYENEKVRVFELK